MDCFFSNAVFLQVSALKHLGDERVLFQRERAVGVDCTAYFCAKLLIVLLEDTARAVIFTGIYHNFLVPKTGFGTYVMMMMLVSFACSGVGFFISTVRSSPHHPRHPFPLGFQPPLLPSSWE